MKPFKPCAKFTRFADWPSAGRTITADNNDNREEPNPRQKPGNKKMQLRFRVNQAEAFRQGVNVPKSIVTVEVDAAALPDEERNLIADRMDGIDVCEGVLEKNGRVTPDGYSLPGDLNCNWRPTLIKAQLPTYEGFIEAVRKDEQKLRTKTGQLGAVTT